jgi:hypothetical protein
MDIFLPQALKVTFQNNAEQPIPLPDPKLLTLHLAIAEILNASGMGEEIEACPRDDNDGYNIGCLAEDGSTNVVEAVERWLVKVN